MAHDDPFELPPFNHQIEAMLARMSREDHEMLGPALRRFKYRDKGWEHKPARQVRFGGKGRGRQSLNNIGVDFSFASPISSTPRQSDAARIPHIEIKHITRVVVPTKGGKIHPRYPAVIGVAAGHHAYVTAGAFSYATHYDYITRQAGGREPGDFMPVVDLLDFEADHREENALAVISNIGVTAARQRSLFEAAERCERTAKSGTLIASTEHAAAWAEAAGEPDAPAWVGPAARLLATAIAEIDATAAKNRKPVAHKTIELCKVNLDEAYDRLVWADSAFGAESAALPDFEQGPCDRVQTRFVCELPRNLKPIQYRQILERICARLGDDGWMYVAAIHRPDPHNNLSNMHIHIDAYDRPSRYLEDEGCWDFEFRVRKRNGKYSYPHRQNKIAVTRGERGGKNGLETGSAYFKALRSDYVAILNDATAGASGIPHYVAGTYAQNGIAQRPLRHLGNKVIANEKNGIVTASGGANARRMFDDVLDRIRRDLLQRRLDLRTKARDRLRAAKTSAAQRAVREWRRLANYALRREAQAEVVDVVARMLTSRAQAVIDHSQGNDRKTLATARAWIGEIEVLTPQVTERVAETEILARIDAAAAAELARAESNDAAAMPPLAYQAKSLVGLAPVPANFRAQVRGRLIRWLDEHEQDPAYLVLDEATVRLGPAVNEPSIDRLFRLFGGEIVIQERLHAERTRRMMAAIIASASTPAGKPNTSKLAKGPSARSLPAVPPSRGGITAQAARSARPAESNERPIHVRSKGPAKDAPVDPLSNAKDKDRPGR